jgi:L-lactate utilization protein LutC
MSAGRDAFLQRVRHAVRAGNRAGQAPPLPARGSLGYQGAGPDPVARFRDEFTAAGGQVHVVGGVEAAVERVLDLVLAKAARRVLLGAGAVLDALNLGDPLSRSGIEVTAADTLAVDCREPLFAADLSITGVDFLVAETGTLAIFTGSSNPRSLSLLPPVHVAVARADQIVADLFDLFGQETGVPNTTVPSCITLITGPSKTGDIELRLVTGVHGPGEVHVVVIK